MRRLFIPSLVFAVALNLMNPAPARANKWLAWLEELSGPGPFHGWVVTADVACLGSPPEDVESAALFLSAAVKARNGSDAEAAQAFDAFMTPIYQRQNLQLLPGDLKTLGGLLLNQKMALPVTFNPAVGIGVANQTTQAAANAAQPNADAQAAANAAGTPEAEAAAIAFWTEYERQQRRFRRCRVDRSNNIVSIQLEIGRYSDDDRSAQRYEGHTRLTTVNAIAYLPVERLIRWNWRRSLSPGGRFVEVGTGVGAYGLNGSTLRDEDLWRGVVPMRVRIIPSEFVYAMFRPTKPGLDVSLNPKTEANRWRRLLQAVEYRFGQDLVLGTLDRDLYGAEGPVTIDQKHEWVRSYGFNFDLGIAFRALIGH